MKNEKINEPISGYAMLIAFTVVFAIMIFTIIAKSPLFAFLLILLALLARGFFFVNPNGSRVLVLFGDYKGTVKKNGFFWTNPFYHRKAVSLRARNFDSERVKVNDKVGNPILIGVILVWQVKDTWQWTKIPVDQRRHSQPQLLGAFG